MTSSWCCKVSNMSRSYTRRSDPIQRSSSADLSVSASLCLCTSALVPLPLSRPLSVSAPVPLSLSLPHTHSLSLVLVVMIKSKELKTKISHAQSLILSLTASAFPGSGCLSRNCSSWIQIVLILISLSRPLQGGVQCSTDRASNDGSAALRATELPRIVSILGSL